MRNQGWLRSQDLGPARIAGPSNDGPQQATDATVHDPRCGTMASALHALGNARPCSRERRWSI